MARTPSRLSRPRLLGLLRLVLAIVVVAAVAVALARNWEAVAGELARVRPATLAAAAAAAGLSPVLTMLGWRAVLADLGSPLHVAPAGGVFFVGQLGKYLPGSVWSVVAQAEMASRLQVPRRRSAVAGLIAVAMAAVTGLAVGVPALPALLRHEGSVGLIWSVAVVLPLLGLALWPRLLNRAIVLTLRVLRRPPLEHDLSVRAVVTVAVLFTGAWLSTGAHVLLLARAVAPDGADPVAMAVASVSGFALASSMGMLAIVLPAGVGLREGVLVLLLTPLMPAPAAIAVVVLSRFLTTVLDVAFAVTGWVYARTHRLVSSSTVRSGS
jgi:uncharacterized membrane protein YbhN (UPF0104 family)